MVVHPVRFVVPRRGGVLEDVFAGGFGIVFVVFLNGGTHRFSLNGSAEGVMERA
jgi:hypothetical protein